LVSFEKIGIIVMDVPKTSRSHASQFESIVDPHVKHEKKLSSFPKLEVPMWSMLRPQFLVAQ
jgi:hypothetical protein